MPAFASAGDKVSLIVMATSLFRRANREVEVVGELNGGSEVTGLVHEIVRSTTRNRTAARTRPQGAIFA